MRHGGGRRTKNLQREKEENGEKKVRGEGEKREEKKVKGIRGYIMGVEHPLEQSNNYKRHGKGVGAGERQKKRQKRREKI